MQSIQVQVGGRIHIYSDFYSSCSYILSKFMHVCYLLLAKYQGCSYSIVKHNKREYWNQKYPCEEIAYYPTILLPLRSIIWLILRELFLWTSKTIIRLIMFSCISCPAKPAKHKVAFETCHMIASFLLLYWSCAFWAFLYNKLLHYCFIIFIYCFLNLNSITNHSLTSQVLP